MEAGFRILMVDDVARYQALYEQAIAEVLPAKFSFAHDGEEALAKLAPPASYDLLILDLNMPRLNGEETLRRIRQDPGLDHMPVVILTGDAGAEVHRRLLELGANDFIEKGVSPEIFVARLKAQLRHKLALDRLARVAVDMDLFAAGVLHDIRSLETTIRAIVELTRDSLLNAPLASKPQMLEDLTALEDKAEQLGQYATAIIAMVRETHKPLRLKEQMLPPLLAWAVRIVGASCSDHRLKPSFEIRGVLKPVVADKYFIQLILLNVIQNSLKYSRPGVRPHLIVSQRPGHPDHTRVQSPSIVTCLRDHGRGIKPSDLRRVFEPFVRGTDADLQPGFGLGLALVVKVMAAMGGRAWAEMPEDGLPGTVICLELPLAQSQVPEYII